jgi:hypothetical protein
MPASIGIAHAIQASVPVRQIAGDEGAVQSSSIQRVRQAPSSRDGRYRWWSETTDPKSAAAMLPTPLIVSEPRVLYELPAASADSMF